MNRCNRPLVTLVVLGFNQERYIDEAITGALAQTYSPLQVLLSDDCSTDGTFSRMEAAVATYRGPHQVLLNRNATNLHIGAHIQRASELATGELIVVNAGDDVSEPHRVERLVTTWQSSSPRPDLLHSASRRLSPEGEIGTVVKPAFLLRHNPSPLQLAGAGEGVMGATQAWHRSLFDRFPALGQHIHCEDRILPFRAALGGGIAYVDEPLIRYRTGGISADFLAESAREVLWGSGLKVHRWLREGFAQMQRDLEARPELASDPQVSAALARGEAMHAAPLRLAAAPYLQRWWLTPSILRDRRLPLQDRVRSTVMYLAPGLYGLQLETRRRLGRL